MTAREPVAHNSGTEVRPDALGTSPRRTVHPTEARNVPRVKLRPPSVIRTIASTRLSAGTCLTRAPRGSWEGVLAVKAVDETACSGSAASNTVTASGLAAWQYGQAPQPVPTSSGTSKVLPQRGQLTLLDTGLPLGRRLLLSDRQ